LFSKPLNIEHISALEDALIWNPGNLVIGPSEDERKTKYGEKFDEECYKYL
jgi:hypothetical protein